ncbi:FAD-dependent oxidoreductase [Paeniroseomonas aquatica]|uniref:FAD-dependent oxidoreductase n=1 Tax=Paeniroseomonas aquatica TaxID=373043 RepID=UPI003606E550
MGETHFDCAVIGAGIVGLAHALAASRAGLRVVVLEREARATGASIRNFGFVTVTGQEQGDCWRRARRARDVWAEVAPQAGIAVHHRGLVFAARRPEALAVLEEFAAGPMGAGCRLLTAAEAAGLGALRADLAGAMHSPHELRVESRDAIPRLTAWLAEARGSHSAPSPRCMRSRPGGCTAAAAPSPRTASSSARERISAPSSPRSSPAAPSRSASCTCCGWRRLASGCRAR